MLCVCVFVCVHRGGGQAVTATHTHTLPLGTQAVFESVCRNMISQQHKHKHPQCVGVSECCHADSSGTASVNDHRRSGHVGCCLTALRSADGLPVSVR